MLDDIDITRLGPYRFLFQTRPPSPGLKSVVAVHDDDASRRVLVTFVAREYHQADILLEESEHWTALGDARLPVLLSSGTLDTYAFTVHTFHPSVPLDRLLGPEPWPEAAILGFSLEAIRAVRAVHEETLLREGESKPVGLLSSRAFAVTPEGRVNLLCFPLFKVAQLADPSFDRRDHAPLLYMSPEQVQGLTVDPLTDVWSLGVVLYELTVGKRPFEATTNIMETLSALRDADFVPPNVASKASLPPIVEQLIERCLVKEPAKRWESLQAMEEYMIDRLGPRSESVLSVLREQLVASSAWTTLYQRLVQAGFEELPRPRYAFAENGVTPLSSSQLSEAIWIDRHRVTCGEYAEFLAATDRPPPPSWTALPPPGRAEEPVVEIRQGEAADYASWRNQRLPTAKEWQSACTMGLLDDADTTWEWTSTDDDTECAKQTYRKTADGPNGIETSTATDRALTLGFRCVFERPESD